MYCRRAPLKEEEPTEESTAATAAAAEDEDNAGIDIRDPDDFKEVFQTRAKLGEQIGRAAVIAHRILCEIAF